MVDWRSVHQTLVEGFAASWDKPHPRAWDDFLVEDVELNQPLIPKIRGRRKWWEESGRLLALLPDLRSDVVGWSGCDDILFIEHRFSATVGRIPAQIPAVDKIWMTESGKVLRRDAFFDPLPFAQLVLRQPSAWLPWWRSGLEPLAARRRFRTNRA
ncbi:nuclear transport factor 2 family protein [Spirillospora sp. CA-142024]|uniref:nuclear transport factor 2 family protein n=1 Tax=Spirillospora sp. CA-142024 TaxID=3240036 RepID=UPI003D90C27A